MRTFIQLSNIYFSGHQLNARKRKTKHGWISSSHVQGPFGHAHTFIMSMSMDKGFNLKIRVSTSPRITHIRHDYVHDMKRHSSSGLGLPYNFGFTQKYVRSLLPTKFSHHQFYRHSITTISIISIWTRTRFLWSILYVWYVD